MPNLQEFLIFSVFPAYSKHARWIKSYNRGRLKHCRRRTEDVVPYMRGKFFLGGVVSSLGVVGNARLFNKSAPPGRLGIVAASPAMFPTWLHLWVQGGQVLQFSPFLNLEERNMWSRGQPGLRVRLRLGMRHFHFYSNGSDLAYGQIWLQRRLGKGSLSLS